ncbi:MAG: KilA-N domain-containing protein, partial [Lutispora sp.]|nr:KilA-N domain-containing protein [Lutispora sp.]
MAKITVKDTEITVIKIDSDDYISLTDIARVKNPDANSVIANWMRNRNTIEYLGVWEHLYNIDFKPLEFEGFLNEAGANAFTLSPKKWIESTNAIGIISKWNCLDSNNQSVGKHVIFSTTPAPFHVDKNGYIYMITDIYYQ